MAIIWMSKYATSITWNTSYLWLLADLSTNLQCLLSEHVDRQFVCGAPDRRPPLAATTHNPTSDISPNVSSSQPHAPCGWGQIVLVRDATENQGRGGGMMREYNIRLGAYWPTVGSGGRPGHMAEGRGVGDWFADGLYRSRSSKQ